MIKKFRAWNRDDNIMCYDDEDDSSNYWDGVCCSIVGLINANISSGLTYDYMQFTGLQDKDGKDIYEGDILEFSDKWEWYRSQYTFKFMGREGKDLEEIQAKYDAEPMERREVAMPECYEWLLSSEIQQHWCVAGNIHENSELLNETCSS